MVIQVLNWPLASDNSLDKESKHGKHGKPSILDLLHLHRQDQDMKLKDSVSRTGQCAHGMGNANFGEQGSRSLWLVMSFSREQTSAAT